MGDELRARTARGAASQAASGCGSSAGTGPRSNRTWARSTPATPSMSAWWVFEISAKRGRRARRPPPRPSMIHISHSGLERSSCWQKIRPARSRSCSSVPGRGSAVWRTWYSRLKRRVVDPQRPPGLQRRRRQLLAVARHEVQAAADVVEHVLERRRAAPRRSSAPRRACATTGPPGAGTTRRAPSGGRSAPEPSASPLAHPQNAGGYKRRNAGARRPLRLRSARAAAAGRRALARARVRAHGGRNGVG